MGSREKNFYNALAVRMGFGEAAAKVQDLFLGRQQRDAMAAVPYEFIDQTSLLGDRASDRGPAGRAGRGRASRRVRWSPYGDSVEEKLDALTVAAEALEMARSARPDRRWSDYTDHDLGQLSWAAAA